MSLLSRLTRIIFPGGSCKYACFSTSSAVTRSHPTSTDPVFSTSQGKSLSVDEMSAFKHLLPDLIHELTYNGHHKDMPNVNQHLAKSISYNLTNGKLNRGMTVPLTYKLLARNGEFTNEITKEANILGWCVEFLQAFFLVADDIMDGSTTRRGKDCWYRKENLGVLAINDAILLESCIYTLLDKYFGDKPYYLNILDAFLYTTRHTAMGQQLDLMSSSCKIDDFDMKRYSQIVQYKTSYYSFYLPVQLGMVLANIKDPELFRQARTILLLMGHLFQVQDDYLDCYGDPSVTGKIGTDIQDGKCSWLIVVAMQRANESQKALLRANYGKTDQESVSNVKAVFEELSLQKMYKVYEEETYNDILHQISHLSGGAEKRALNHDIFHTFLSKIYKREA